MAQRTDAPAVTTTQALAAIARREDLLGHPLTAGQDAAVQAMATSGRGIDIVVGVAGAGKTTALAAVRDAFASAHTAAPEPATPAGPEPFIPVGLRRSLAEAAAQRPRAPSRPMSFSAPRCRARRRGHWGPRPASTPPARRRRSCGASTTAGCS